jgi:hypothetical protein
MCCDSYAVGFVSHISLVVYGRDLDGAMTATSLRFPLITKADPSLALLTQSPFVATMELGTFPVYSTRNQFQK